MRQCDTPVGQIVGRSAAKKSWNAVTFFGVPVLLNTSFNLKGEPIVNTPREAISTFSKSEMDVVVLGECIVEK